MPICSPTTCSFSATELSGLIDFYFACNDMLAYDVAICLNAWCFESDASFNVTKARAMLAGLSRASGARARTSSPPADARARCGAALSLDPHLRHAQHRRERAGEDQGPNEYLRKLRFHQRREILSRLRARQGLTDAHGGRPKVVIHTDGACSGNPGPGGWGAILESGAHRKELKGGEPLTTNNRMELTPPSRRWKR